MRYSNYLFNYNKETLRKMKESKLLIIDLDGTLIDFEKIDGDIIHDIFKDNKMVKFMDNILWKINKLDILGNGYTALKLRLFVYTLFSKYNMKEVKQMYKKQYEKYASRQLRSIYPVVIDKLINAGKSVVIVTKNVYAKDLFKKTKDIISVDGNVQLLSLNKNKKEKFKELVARSDGKATIIGNNLTDDILNSFKVGLPYIYIGRSSIVNTIINFTNKHFKKDGVQVDNIKKILQIFL